MPIRSKSHEIEDASRRHFATLLTEKWVVRDKASDYGVDAEVEIFDDSGNSTGLLFNVQLRGTDEDAQAQKMTLKLDQLNYFYSLDLPTIIVRYHRPTNSVYAKWHFSIKPDHKESSQKTMTIHFSDEEKWGTETRDKIRSVINTLRLAKSYRIYNQLEVSLYNLSASTDQRFNFELALDMIVKDSKNVRMKSGPIEPNRIEMKIHLEADAVKFEIEDISSIRIELDDFDVDVLTAQIGYAIAALAFQVGLCDHARTLCIWLLWKNIVCPSADLAFLAIRALNERPAEMVRLAMMNNLHTAETEAAMMFNIFIFQHGVASEEHNNAMKAWIVAILENIDPEKDPQSAAHMEYNLGNREKCEGNFRGAIAHYNRARKLYPEYVNLDYYQRELAGTLFCARRYSMAEYLYVKSCPLGEKAHFSLLRGDAHFFKGNFSGAEKAYSDAHKLAGKTPLVWEATLKSYLASELKRMSGDSFQRRSFLAKKKVGQLDATDPDFEKQLNEIWSKLDPLDPLTNFNFGISLSQAGKFNEAFGHFLVCAFSNTGDEEAWSCAAICAHNVGGEILLHTLGAAVETCGMSAYRRLRNSFRDQGMPAEATELLDFVVRELGRPGDPSEEFLNMAEKLRDTSDPRPKDSG